MNIKTIYASIIMVFMLNINILYAQKPEDISVLPTKKAPLLVHVNTEANAQYMAKNLSTKTLRLAMFPQKGVKQDTSGLLACGKVFILVPGQKCLLNLIISGSVVGQKIKTGPLICQVTQSGKIGPNTSLCTQASPRDSLDVTIIKPKKSIINVSPRALTIHAASVSPDKLSVTNLSYTLTAKDIKAQLPEGWKDVTQNAKACVRLKPRASCNIYFQAKKANPIAIVPVAGSNTITVRVKIMVKPHDVRKLGPAVEPNDIELF